MEKAVAEEGQEKAHGVEGRLRRMRHGKAAQKQRPRRLSAPEDQQAQRIVTAPAEGQRPLVHTEPAQGIPAAAGSAVTPVEGEHPAGGQKPGPRGEGRVTLRNQIFQSIPIIQPPHCKDEQAKLR